MDIRGWFRLYIEQVMFLIFHIVFPQYFLSIRGFFTGTGNSQDSRGKEGIIFYSTLPIPSAQEHSDNYLQLCMWTFRPLFATSLVFTTRWDLPLCQVTVWLTDDVCWFSFVCLLILILDFATAVWHEKPVDSDSHQLSSLYYKQTD